MRCSGDHASIQLRIVNFCLLHRDPRVVLVDMGPGRERPLGSGTGDPSASVFQRSRRPSSCVANEILDGVARECKLGNGYHEAQNPLRHSTCKTIPDHDNRSSSDSAVISRSRLRVVGNLRFACVWVVKSIHEKGITRLQGGN